MIQSVTSGVKPPADEGPALSAPATGPFQGFGQVSSFTPIPDLLLDELMTRFEGAELKILLYIIRRTYGFGKPHDAISYNQFLHGITTREGRRLDYGTGLARSTLASGLARLVQLGYIFRHEGQSRYGTVYELNLDGAPHYNQHPATDQSEDQPEDQSGDQSEDQPEDQSGDQSEDQSQGRSKNQTSVPVQIEPVADSSIFVPATGATETVPGANSSIIKLEGSSIFVPANAEKQTLPEGSSIFVPVTSSEIEPEASTKIELTINSSPINSSQNTVSQEAGLTETNLRVTPEFELRKRKLSRLLQQQAINRGESDRLARLLLANGRDENYIQGWTAWIARQDFIDRPAAYLRRLIEQDEELPGPAPAPTRPTRPGDLHQRKGAGLDFSKYGPGGKYAHLTAQAKPRNWRFNAEQDVWEEIL